MKTKTKAQAFLSKLLVLLFVSVIFMPIFQSNSQERGPLKRYKWYYSQRNYPFDTIPQGAYGDAVAEKNTLTLTNGYQLSSPSVWSPIGPSPFQWTSGLICSGRITNVKYDKRDTTGNTIYVTAAEGGVWKSTNNGSNWTDISGDLPTLSAGGFAIDTTNDILYFGSGDPAVYYGSEKGTGIYKSTNDGINWINISSGLPKSTVIFKIEIKPDDPDILFLAEFHGLYKSTNAGVSWTKVLPSTGSLNCTDVCFSPSGDYIYAVGPSGDFWPDSWFNGIGYWKSTNEGASFEEIGIESGFPHDNVPYGRSCITVSNSSDSIVWILSYDNIYEVKNNEVYDNRMFVYRSTNNGSNFTNFTKGESWNMGGNAGFNEIIKCSDSDPDICFMGLQDLFRTTDGGSTWSDCIAGYCNTHADMHALDFRPSDPEQKIMIGNDGGVFRSENLGDSWTSVNYDLNITMIYKVASNTYSEDNVLGGFQDYGYGYLSTGTLWITTSMGHYDGTQMLSSPFKSNRYTASTNAYGYLHYSSDGANFTSSSDYVGYHFLVAPMANHPVVPGNTFTVRQGPFTDNKWIPVYIHKSTNYGASWGGSSPHRTISDHDYDLVAPNVISVSPSNPDYILMSMGNGSEFWHYTFGAVSRLFKSTNGGANWLNEPSGSFAPILEGGTGVPDRFFTHVEFDPEDEDIVYLTLSGYGTGHVYRSTNGGYNWTDISGDLPNSPVNDLIIHFPDASSKQIIIGSDVGVFVTDASSISWRELADNLPNTSVSDLDYNRLSGMLRASSFGRGIHELDLSANVYVQDNLYITDNVTLNKDIVVASGGKLIIGHSSVNTSMSITFNNGANIIVEDGGTLDASSNVAVTLTSSGTWGGIELNGDCSATLKNCTFQNTSTPIVIEGTFFGAVNPPDITIDGCTFSAPVEITNRKDVIVKNSSFTYSSGSVPSVLGVICTGSDNALISNNSITSSSAISSTGISVIYGSDVVVQKNVINNITVGISVSNSSPLVSQNRITNSSASNAVVGIGFDNAYSGNVKENTVIGYQMGYKLYYSSPNMYMDSSYNTNTSGDSVNGLHAVYISNPRLKPDDSSIELIWIGGKNYLKTTAKGNGIYMYLSSVPNIDFGYNFIYGYDYYLFGDGPGVINHYVRCNDWVDDPPNSSKFNLSNPGSIIYSPYGCTPPGGSGFSSLVFKEEPGKAESDPMEEGDNPPQNIIVSYGHGINDTIKVTSRSFELSADQQLYGQGVKEELLGNYQSAITKYKDVVQNYQDSAISISALKKILTCHEKMNADTGSYSTLRTYYLSLNQLGSSETPFSKAVREMAIKTLVKKGDFAAAITQYEDVISASNDPYEDLCAELNIIETYMIMTEQGDAPGFTGRLAHLKPQNRRDGLAKLLEKLYNVKPSVTESVLPTQFSLSQNYPNPFNPLTTIKFAIPKASKVTLKIYDILGKEVASLVNEFKDAGFYDVKFDGSRFASGVYFYRIEAGDFVQSKKMILVK